MRPKIYKILEIAVGKGVSYGYNRAHKHIENPPKEQICEQVMNSILDYFSFDEERKFPEMMTVNFGTEPLSKVKKDT